jgi:hypothetical protein
VSDDVFAWTDPPDRSGRRTRTGIWLERLGPVMEREGTWARVYRCPTKDAASSMVSNLRSGRSKPPPGKWEFEHDDEGFVYARYLGDGDESNDQR